MSQLIFNQVNVPFQNAYFNGNQVQAVWVDDELVYTSTLPGSQIFDTAGVHQFVIPPGVSLISVEAIGGGGSGSTIKRATGPSDGAAGAGYAGAHVAHTLNVYKAGSINVTVGAGGAAAGDGTTGSVNGNPGTSSYVEGGIAASGGAGGILEYTTPKNSEFWGQGEQLYEAADSWDGAAKYNGSRIYLSTGSFHSLSAFGGQASKAGDGGTAGANGNPAGNGTRGSGGGAYAQYPSTTSGGSGKGGDGFVRISWS